MIIKNKQLNTLKTKENGASLAIILLFVSFILGSFAFYYKSQDVQLLSNKAAVAAWEGMQIARAARIFVRDQIANTVGPNPQQQIAAISTTSPRITIEQLINANLLPVNFLGFGTPNVRTNTSGNFINALGQEIIIIQQNFPLNGNINDPNTVPTAYVVYNETPNIDNDIESNLMRDVAASMQRMTVMLYAPLYNGANNISSLCRGEPSIAYWDTNCINNTDYNILTGENFNQGSLVIPTWRTVTFDTRAVMRFPQPEQSGLNMMLTDLSMANDVDCSRSVTINDPTGSRLAGGQSEMGEINATNIICETADDNPAAILDNRRSILSPSFVEADNLILDPQADLDVYSYDTIAGAITKPLEDNNVVIPGILTIQNGETRIFDNNSLTGTGIQVNENAFVDSNVILSGNNAASTASAFNTVQSDNVSAQNLTLNNSIVTTNANINAATLSSNGNLLVNSNMAPNTITINATNNFDITADELSVHTFTGTINQFSLSGSGPLLNGNFNLATRDLNLTGDMTSNNTLSADDVRIVGQLNNGRGRIDVTNSGLAQCRGDCPLRSGTAICTNLRDQGRLTTAGFGSFNECLQQYQ